jgi:hypothetical protein
MTLSDEEIDRIRKEMDIVPSYQASYGKVNKKNIVVDHPKFKIYRGGPLRAIYGEKYQNQID